MRHIAETFLARAFDNLSEMHGDANYDALRAAAEGADNTIPAIAAKALNECMLILEKASKHISAVHNGEMDGSA